MNFLFIALDTQRADHLSCYGYCRQTSPNLDALAAEGVLFENCITQTAHTMPTFTTMMTGQDPSSHGIVGTLWAHPNEPDQRLDDTTPLLAQIMRDNGRLTAAFDNLANWACAPAWFGRGYDWYVNTRWEQAHGLVRAEDINARLVPWLHQHAQEKPWFLFVHYWDPHQAYNQPEPYRTLHSGGPEPEQVKVNGCGYRPGWGWAERLDQEACEKIDLYDGEISYVDAAIGQVLDALREQGVYEETAIIVTGDHGEDFAEHNAPFEHREPYETTVHVPLIFKPPARLPCASGQRVPGIVGHIDLMPSILDMARIEPPAGLDGKSWLPLAQGERGSIHEALLVTGGAIKPHGTWVSPDLAIRTATHKCLHRGTAISHEGQTLMDVVVLCRLPSGFAPEREAEDFVNYFNSLPRQELYDLRTDPHETTNIADQQPEIAAQLNEYLREFAARNPTRLIYD